MQRPSPAAAIRDRLAGLDASGANGFEGLVRDALAEATRQRFDIASSGKQGGVDAMSRGNVVSIAVKAKRYQASTRLGLDDLKAKVADASQSYPDLDIWVIAATRELPLQDARALEEFGAGFGIKVLVLDSREGPRGLDGVSVLLAAAPDTCKKWFADDEAVLTALTSVRANADYPSTSAALTAELDAADLGWDAARRAMASWTREAMADQGRSRKRLDTYAELLAPGTTLVDRLESEFLDRCRSAPGTPWAVLGLEGYGKTWAVLKWWNERAGPDGTGLPLTVVIPARDARGDDPEELIAAALAARTGLRDAAYWKRRLGRWRKGGTAPLLVVFDGLNQARFPVAWSDLVRPLISDEWAGRVSVVLTARQTEWRRLHGLCDLTPAPETHELGPYSDAQVDGLLHAAGLDRAGLDPRLLELMKVPRLFALASARANGAIRLTELTPEALALEEYRHRLQLHGERLPLGEQGFRNLVARLGRRFRDSMAGAQGTHITRRELLAEITLESGDRAGLEAMVSELASGRWLEEREENRFTLDTRAAPLALALALVEAAREETRPPEAFFPKFLDVFRGSDLGVAVLRAACAVALIGGGVDGGLRHALLLEWITAQNFNNDHYRTFWRLACLAPEAVLDFAERVWRGGRTGQELDEVLTKGLAQAAGRQAAARDAVLARLARWLGTWWPDHLEGRILSGASEVPGAEERTAEVGARAADWAREVQPRLPEAPALHPASSEGGWAWVARRALVTLSYLPRADAVGPLRAWAAAGAIFGSPCFPEVAAWVLRSNDLDPNAAGPAAVAAAEEFLSTGHPLATEAARALLRSLATPEAQAVLDRAEDAEPPVREVAPLDAGSFRGLEALDSRHPEEPGIEEAQTAVHAAWDGGRLRETLASLPMKDAGELLALLARWAPGRVPAAVDAWLDLAPDLEPERFRQLVGLACTLPMVFGPDARRRLLEVAQASFAVSQERLRAPLLVLRLLGADGRAQFAALAEMPGVPLEAAFDAVLDRLPIESLEAHLRHLHGTGERDELLRWLGFALGVKTTSPPAGDTVLLDLAGDPDAAIRASAMGVLHGSGSSHLAIAFSRKGWRWAEGTGRLEAAYGSLLLLKASSASEPDALERADPQVAAYAYRDDERHAGRFAAYVDGRVDWLCSPTLGAWSTEFEWADDARELERLAAERPDQAEAWLRRLAGRGLHRALVPVSPLNGLLRGLMRGDPVRAAPLWREALSGAGGRVRSDSLELMPFMVPCVGAVEGLRREALERALDDARLAQVAFFATRDPGDEWLARKVRDDLRSPAAATVARALTLAGYGRATGSMLELWASDLAAPPATGWLGQVRRQAAAEFARHRAALELGRAFAAAPDDAAAGAAFLRFRTVSDPRATEMVAEEVNDGRLAMNDARKEQWSLDRPVRDARFSALRSRREETFCGTRRERSMHPWL